MRPVPLQRAHPLQVLTLLALQVQLQEGQLLYSLPPRSPWRLVLGILQELQVQPHFGLVRWRLVLQLQLLLLAPEGIRAPLIYYL